MTNFKEFSEFEIPRSELKNITGSNQSLQNAGGCEDSCRSACEYYSEDGILGFFDEGWCKYQCGEYCSRP